VSAGGTGAANAAAARTNLGISATNTPFTPAGNIAATDVQAALNELDTEKAALAGATFTGQVTVPSSLRISAEGGDGVAIDVIGNSLRIFENGGAARGVIVDLTACGSQSVLYHAGNFNPASYLPLSGGTMTGQLTISNTSPTITMADTDSITRSIHCNGNIIGFLNSGGGWSMQNDNSGQIWSQTYGMLHDYFIHRLRTTSITDQSNWWNAGGPAIDSPWVVTGLWGSGASVSTSGVAQLTYRARVLQMYYSGGWHNVNAG
jgi:hypothetical protein